MRRPFKGQAWRPPSAADQGAIANAADTIRRGIPSPSPDRQRIDTDLIQVKNVTGGNLALGSVLEIGDLLLTDKTNENIWFEGDTPDSSTSANRVCIVRQAMADDDIGHAQVSGVVVALVNVTNTSHVYCSTTNGQTYLTSGASGSFPICNTPTSTGTQLCVVLLDRAGVKQPWVTFTMGLTDFGSGSPRTTQTNTVSGGTTLHPYITYSAPHATFNTTFDCPVIITVDASCASLSTLSYTYFQLQEYNAGTTTYYAIGGLPTVLAHIRTTDTLISGGYGPSPQSAVGIGVASCTSGRRLAGLYYWYGDSSANQPSYSVRILLGPAN